MARGGPGAPGPRPSSAHLTPLDMRPTQDAADADGPAAPQGCTISSVTATHSHPRPVHAAQRRPRSPSVRPSVRPTHHLPFLTPPQGSSPKPKTPSPPGPGWQLPPVGPDCVPWNSECRVAAGPPSVPRSPARPLPDALAASSVLPHCMSWTSAGLAAEASPPAMQKGPCWTPRGAKEWTRQVTHPSPNVRGGSQDGLWPRAGLGPGVQDGVYP